MSHAYDVLIESVKLATSRDVLEALDDKRLELELTPEQWDAADAAIKSKRSELPEAVVSSKSVTGERSVMLEAECLAIVAGYHDADLLRTECVDKVREKAKFSPSLLDKMARALSSRYVILTGVKGSWTWREASKALREKPRAASLDTLELTHVGVAQAIVREHAGDLRTVVEHEKHSWLKWDGCRWTPLTDKELGTLVSERVQSLKEACTSDPGLDAKAYKEVVHTLGHNSFNFGVASAMAHQREAHVRSSELDTHREYLTVANGAVHVQTGELVADRELLLTLVNEVAYNPDATCPNFQKVLEDMFPAGTDDRNWFELVMGYTMSGAPVEKAMFFHKGTRDNGKSLILNAIMDAMGAHATPASSALIAGDDRSDSEDGNGPSPMLHNLKNRRMAFIDEIPQGKVLKEGFVKQIASGLGQLQGRRLGGQLDSFPIRVAVHVACNNIASVRGGQQAAWERICPVVYTTQFIGDKADTGLAERLKEEREGIFVWLLECARKYAALKAAGKTLKSQMPESARREHEALRKEQNPLLEWMAERCIVVSNGFVSTTDAVLDFNEYVRRFDPQSKVAFKSAKAMVKRMAEERLGVQHREQVITDQAPRKRMSGFVGLALKGAKLTVKGMRSDEAEGTLL